MVFRLTKPKYLADGWDFHQTLGPKILWFFSAEGRSLQHVKKHQKNHSFGANFIRKVKHVTKRSSLFTVNYWELLNHNLQKTKQHLLTPAESREKLGTGWASTFNSSCGHGQESRSSAFCDLSRPLRSDEALRTESGRTPQVVISWSACGHSKQCETPCYIVEGPKTNRILKISKASEKQLQYVSLVCLESNCLERSGQKSQMLDLSSWDISKITQEILLYLKHFSKSTASF